METTLDPIETRVIGSLIEKEITTPDHYPLSLNALTNACNQKSNRDPVMSLAENEVQDALDQLRAKHLVLDRSGFGSRVVKYRQRFCNTEFSDLRFTPGETAIICLLFLRGPQTAGELRSRSGRLHTFGSLSEVEDGLRTLAAREDGALVAPLPREPGRREVRWTHCFGDEDVEATQASVLTSEPATRSADETLERIANLEAQVADLVERLDSIERRGGS